jgi:hypothetical protein
MARQLRAWVRKQEKPEEEAAMTKPKKRKSPRSIAKLSTLDDFLKEDGKLEEFQAIAIGEVLAWQSAKG